MGLFPPGKGGGDDVEYGFKGKGITQHLLIDGSGMPLAIITTSAAESERAQIINLQAQVKIFGGNRRRPRSCPDELQTDKGYDAKELRGNLRRKGVKPLVPRREWEKRKQPRGPKPEGPKDRWKVERCFAWMQKKFRRLCIKWERCRVYWNGFITLAISWMWLTKLV